MDSIRWVPVSSGPPRNGLAHGGSLFKGSATRKQLGMAEVSLTIDNESGPPPGDMPESHHPQAFPLRGIRILLNRKICRLADINDLFMDTGMGTDSYSVFELAMINSILSDKTEDRRHIFEEAAGVTKYKARRKAAVNRMLTIQDDLARVGDIVAELERRTESLRRQAQKDPLPSLEANYGRGRWRWRPSKWDASKRKRTLGRGTRRDTGLSARVSATRSPRMAGGADILSMRCSARNGDSGVRVPGRSVRIALSEREKELARLDSRIEHFEETAAKAREASRRNAEALEDIAEIHGRCAEALAETTARLEEVDRATGEYRERFGDFEIRAAEKDDAFRSLETECRRLEREIASSRNLIDRRVRRETGETRLKEITRRIGELETSEGESAVECARLREDRSRNAAYVDGHERALGELTANLSAVAEELETIDRDLRDLRGREASLAAERISYRVLAGFRGYSEGVRNAASSDCLAGGCSAYSRFDIRRPPLASCRYRGGPRGSLWALLWKTPPPRSTAPVIWPRAASDAPYCSRLSRCTMRRIFSPREKTESSGPLICSSARMNALPRSYGGCLAVPSWWTPSRPRSVFAPAAETGDMWHSTVPLPDRAANCTPGPRPTGVRQPSDAVTRSTESPPNTTVPRPNSSVSNGGVRSARSMPKASAHPSANAKRRSRNSGGIPHCSPRRKQVGPPGVMPPEKHWHL